MMSKNLQDAKAELEVQLPLVQGVVSARNVPIQDWTPEEVGVWVATVESGRFAQMVLPPMLDGKGLLALSAQNLACLFEGDMRDARRSEEGTSWNIAGYEEGRGSGAPLGKALFSAVRREALSGLKRSRERSANAMLTGGIQSEEAAGEGSS